MHHYPVQRLEAEAIRDAMLAVSGTLDQTTFGPSVPPYISKFQDGRGKPESGPLDGAGRRSIYIQVRRNFLTPMFLASIIRCRSRPSGGAASPPCPRKR